MGGFIASMKRTFSPSSRASTSSRERTGGIEEEIPLSDIGEGEMMISARTGEVRFVPRRVIPPSLAGATGRRCALGRSCADLSLVSSQEPQYSEVQRRSGGPALPPRGAGYHIQQAEIHAREEGRETGVFRTPASSRRETTQL